MCYEALLPDGEKTAGQNTKSALVAQLDRASDYGSEGWGFEFLRARDRQTDEFGGNRLNGNARHDLRMAEVAGSDGSKNADLTEPAASRRFSNLMQFARENWAAVALLAVPLCFLLFTAWTHRWVSDDGFINLRVVQQIAAGNGPVFNAGERVEAATSPLWILCLLVGRTVLFWLPVEWVAVVLGIAMTATAVLLSFVAAARVYGTTRLVPLGVIFYIVLPPAALFASSGLENCLTLLWISGWYLALVRLTNDPQGRGTMKAAVLIGLAPLIRPDLAVMAVVAGITLMYVSRPRTIRLLAKLVGAGAAIPLLYELFRMGYYGALLPNPAYAKEASAADWSRGWEYLVDLVRPYWLWLPGLLLVAAMWTQCRSYFLARSHAGSFERGQVAKTVVFFTPAVAGTVYALFIVRGGGDFMHGRMLMPTVFALQLAVSAVPRRPAMLAAVAVTVAWAAVPIVADGPPYDRIGPHGITNEYQLEADLAHRSNPVALSDFSDDPRFRTGRRLRRRAEAGEGQVEVWLLSPVGTEPLDANGPSFARGGVIGIGAIGLVSVSAGPLVYVADVHGLASPVGSRIKLEKRGRAGHEKLLPLSWTYAMFAYSAAPTPGTKPILGASPAEVQAAREALGCPEVAAMLNRARAPLTLSRVWNNVVEAVTTFPTRIDGDPVREAANCGR
jgi:arabinofuranosyltransferase